MDTATDGGTKTRALMRMKLRRMESQLESLTDTEGTDNLMHSAFTADEFGLALAALEQVQKLISSLYRPER